MKNSALFFFLGILLSISTSAFSQQTASYTDTICAGPFIFKENHKLMVKWIDNGKYETDLITPENFPELKEKFHLLFDFTDIKDNFQSKPEYKQVYTSVDSLSAISDIHGEYDTYIHLLKAMGIIDENLSWIYGTGHLVLLGDAFDRGDKVTEILWHLFGLEKQAEKAGGMVHVILGNHEFMVLGDNLTYINDKYKLVEEITGIHYPELFSANSVLGYWLRSKPVAITINDIIFVHAGISKEMVDRKLKIELINRGFSNMLAGKSIQTDSDYEQLIFLNDDKGPIWYRGYFNQQDFSENMLDQILSFYDKKHIVVGHTHCEGINPIFKNKIFGIDAGISNNEPGEMLIYKNGKFYRGLSTGERIEL